MAEIETLTEEERTALPTYDGDGAKALRIIDAQAARIAELEKATEESFALLKRHHDAYAGHALGRTALAEGIDACLRRFGRL